MKTDIIAIDPGENGGIAYIINKEVLCRPMPKGMTAIVDFIKDLNPEVVVVEKTGTYVPGNSGPSAAKFARHCGQLEGALYALSIPFIEVPPKTWQKALGTFSKDKAERKRAIKEEVQRRHPHLKVTLKTADALGILEYAIKL